MKIRTAMVMMVKMVKMKIKRKIINDINNSLMMVLLLHSCCSLLLPQ